MTGTLSKQEALIYVMVTMSAVDRMMTDGELERIGTTVKSLPVFKSFNENDLVDVARDCGKVLSGGNNLETVLDLIYASLPVSLRETAYALAVEVAATDASMKPEESRFLELLRGKLEISKLVCAAIERGARARHRSG